MLTLYGDPASRTQRNLWMLNELGIAFELVPTAFLKGETQTTEFLALNPNGHVPVLVDDAGRLSLHPRWRRSYRPVNTDGFSLGRPCWC